MAKWQVFYRFSLGGKVYGGHDKLEATSADKAKSQWEKDHPNLQVTYLQIWQEPEPLTRTNY